MQEIYQITGALKQLACCKHVAVLTDARFSGVSTGACIGHISPEALAGGPIGKIHDGDLIEIRIDRGKLLATVNLVGEQNEAFSPAEGTRRLSARSPRADYLPGRGSGTGAPLAGNREPIHLPHVDLAAAVLPQDIGLPIPVVIACTLNAPGGGHGGRAPWPAIVVPFISQM
jgi:hypothetical protein